MRDSERERERDRGRNMDGRMLGSPFVKTIAESEQDDLVKVDGKFVKVPDWRKTYQALDAKGEVEARCILCL